MIIHKFLLEDLYQTFTLLTWFISETSWFNIFKPMAQWYGAWWKHINCKQACLFTDSQQITYKEVCSIHWPRNNKENRKVIIKIKKATGKAGTRATLVGFNTLVFSLNTGINSFPIVSRFQDVGHSIGPWSKSGSS